MIIILFFKKIEYLQKLWYSVLKIINRLIISNQRLIKEYPEIILKFKWKLKSQRRIHEFQINYMWFCPLINFLIFLYFYSTIYFFQGIVMSVAFRWFRIFIGLSTVASILNLCLLFVFLFFLNQSIVLCFLMFRILLR